MIDSEYNNFNGILKEVKGELVKLVIEKRMDDNFIEGCKCEELVREAVCYLLPDDMKEWGISAVSKKYLLNELFPWEKGSIEVVPGGERGVLKRAVSLLILEMGRVQNLEKESAARFEGGCLNE